MLARQARRAGPVLADYGPPAGYGPLRHAIAAHVSAARDVACEADHIMVTGGAQQVLDLIARTLIQPGDEVWIENPSYRGAQEAFAAAGAKIIPVPIDAQGLNVQAGIALAARARLVYVTPSHQFPLGITMSAARRLELLAWARQTGAWIIENDCDSEFRYTGRPLASLQGLDGGERVIYIETFSRALFPSLRLGYLVLPPGLRDAVFARCHTMDYHTPLLEQAVVAEFLAEGYFARHLRRMRMVYAERRNALLHALERHAASIIRPGPADAGLHLIGWLPDGMADAVVAVRAAEAGIEVMPLSAHWLPATTAAAPPPGLLLGFGGFPPAALASAVERLANLLRMSRRELRRRPGSGR